MMFVDIRDFTAFAEQFEPGEVVETLNCLFELVVPIIAERHGHVDKFVGDGLLAVFGAPAHQPDHADLALDAAAAIARRRETFQGDLEIGIGIDSGTVIAGQRRRRRAPRLHRHRRRGQHGRANRDRDPRRPAT